MRVVQEALRLLQTSGPWLALTWRGFRRAEGEA